MTIQCSCDNSWKVIDESEFSDISILNAIISGSTLSGTTTNIGTISGGTISNTVVTASAISGGTISDSTLSGTITNTGVISGGTLSTITLIGGTTNSGNTISGGTLSGVTLSGTTTNTGVISGGTLSAGTLIGGTTNIGNTISGGALSGATLTGGTTNTGNTIAGGTLSTMTLTGGTTNTGNTITGGSLSGVTLSGTTTNTGTVTGGIINNANLANIPSIQLIGTPSVTYSNTLASFVQASGFTFATITGGTSFSTTTFSLTRVGIMVTMTMNRPLTFTGGSGSVITTSTVPNEFKWFTGNAPSAIIYGTNNGVGKNPLIIGQATFGFQIAVNVNFNENWVGACSVGAFSISWSTV